MLVLRRLCPERLRWSHGLESHQCQVALVADELHAVAPIVDAIGRNDPQVGHWRGWVSAALDVHGFSFSHNVCALTLPYAINPEGGLIALAPVSA